MRQRAVFQDFFVLGKSEPVVIHMGYEPVEEDEEIELNSELEKVLHEKNS